MTQVATEQKIVPFLWFENGEAKDAVEFYVSVFKKREDRRDHVLR